jgi:hypothetical protein
MTMINKDLIQLFTLDVAAILNILIFTVFKFLITMLIIIFKKI